MKHSILFLLFAIPCTQSFATTTVCPSASSDRETLDLTACWNFNQRTTQWVYDLSGNGYHATINNEPSYVNGIDGLGMRFNDDDYLRAQSLTAPLNRQNFTFLFWVKTSAGASQLVFYQQPSQLSGGFPWGVQLDGGDVSMLIQNSTTTTDHATQNQSLDDGEWHFVAITGVGNAISIYIDGDTAERVSSTSSGTILGAPLWGNGAYIGGVPNSSRGLDGDLDDMALLDTALSGEAIQLIYNTVLNRPPVITSTPPATGTEDITYLYPIEAADPDGDPIEYALDKAPEGMILQGDTVVWMPGDEGVGEQSVLLVVTDSNGASTTQSWTITVANVNDVPQITSSAPTNAETGSLYHYQITVNDPDPNEELTYAVLTGPAGMTVTDDGEVRWTPADSQSGAYNVSLTVTDLAAAADTQDYVLSLDGATNTPPVISTAELPDAVEDSAYSLTLEAGDESPGSLQWSLLSGPGFISVESDGQLSCFPLQEHVGSHDLTVTVNDGVLSDTANYTLEVLEVNDPPVIDSTVPQSEVYTAEEEINLPLSATDEEGDDLTWSMLEAPEGAAIVDDTVFNWTPDSTQTGVDTLYFVVSDGVGADTLQHIFLVLSAPVSVLPDREAKGPELIALPRTSGMQGMFVNLTGLSPTAKVWLEVYTLSGRRVLAQKLAAGQAHRITWQGSAQTYTAILQTGGKAYSKTFRF